MLTLPLLLALAACSSEIDNKPAAEVAEATEAPVAEKAAPEAKPEVKDKAKAQGKPTVEEDADDDADEGPASPLKHSVAPPAGSDLVDINDETSSIGFVGAKVTGDHTGSFKDYDGEIAFKDGKVLSTSFVIDLASVETDAVKLTKHLKSADFFEVEKYSTATFRSTAITAGGGDSYTVTGDLDFHGAVKSITFPATIKIADDGVKVASEFTIDRQLWGISYPGKKDDLIKDEVLIKLDLDFPID